MKDLKEVVTLVGALTKAVQGALADGKIGVEDAGHLMTVIPAIGPAIEGIENVSVPATEEQEAEMKEHIKATFGDGAYELLAEDALKAALHFARVLVHVKTLAQ